MAKTGVEKPAGSGKKRLLEPSDFVHLHNHTQYSLLDGLTKVPELIDYTKKTGMDAIAVTDHGTMSSAIEFYKAAKAADLKPIIGMEAYIAARKHTDKDPARDRQYYHLTLLAMNEQGYQNLMRLSTIANLEGFYYKPRIDRDLLQQYADGLIVLSGCIGGEVSDALRQEQYNQAKTIATWYKDIFGDRYYIEVQDSGHPDHPSVWEEQTKVNKQLFKLADELNIPAVLTCDAHYLKHSDQEAHEILLCVQTGSFLSDETRMSLKDLHLHVTDPKELINRWGLDHSELILNSRLIANRCHIDIELGNILIPKFNVPKGETEKSFLQQMVWRGLTWRYGSVDRHKASKLSITESKKTLDKDVIKRAEYELQVIDNMGFNGYFLIVADFINWGKDQGIVFGPGRGSAAGSIVAYATRITELDPLVYDLLFERFLNPDRISMPDIDIDIQDSRRDEVINYCVDKYGQDRVANIVTFGRMAARNSVRDVARVLQVPYSEADRLAKMIPPPIQGRHIPLAMHLRQVTELKKEKDGNEQSSKVFDLAIKLEGTIRSHGVHAAGVVIAPDDIVKFVPLELAQKGVIATQYSMGPIEDLGLLKMDFLGLSNLTIINNALRIIRKVYGKNIDFSMVPLDDKKTFQLLQRGETTGVFQLESAGMRRYLKELMPNQFEDIIAMVSLYRPGPLAEIPKFILGKNHPDQITYPHDSLKPILQNTYGVMVYQEQIIAMLRMIAGYSPGRADLVRKAIGKKNRDIMAAEKPRFIEGCVKQGLTKTEADKLWSLIQPFADYSFNKSHAACYALIAYQTAYLKAHYPDAFMAALMTSDYDNIDRLSIEITECKQLGIEVLPPDVNESFHEFSVVPGKKQIRFGLDAIKNVGHGAAEEIINARQKLGGKFNDIESFCAEVSPQIVNRKALESLIKSGALDRFKERSFLLHNIDNILAHANRLHKDAASGQVGLFAADNDLAGQTAFQIAWQSDHPVYSNNDWLSWERELLGLYLSSHPLVDYQDVLAAETTPLIKIENAMEGRQVTVGGSITEMREIVTKSGAKMAFVKISDMHGEIELVVFPKLYNANPSLWQRDNIIVATGRVGAGRDGSELKILPDQAKLLNLDNSVVAPGPAEQKTTSETVVNKNANKRLYIRLEDSSNEPMLMSLKEKLDTYKGDTEVVLVTGEEVSKQAIKLPQTIIINEESLRDLASVFGATNVVVR